MPSLVKKMRGDPRVVRASLFVAFSFIAFKKVSDFVSRHQVSSLNPDKLAILELQKHPIIYSDSYMLYPESPSWTAQTLSTAGRFNRKSYDDIISSSKVEPQTVAGQGQKRTGGHRKSSLQTDLLIGQTVTVNRFIPLKYLALHQITSGIRCVVDTLASSLRSRHR